LWVPALRRVAGGGPWATARVAPTTCNLVLAARFFARAVRSTVSKSAPNECGAFSLLPFATESKRKRNADRRGSYLRTGRCGARPVSSPSPICGEGFRGGTLACRRPTAALAKGTYVTQGATQAMLPGTRSERVLPAFACPSPVSTSRADRSIGRHDARAGRGRAVSSHPRPPHPLRIPEYLRERRP
jgi:hypothetical protein